MRWQGLIIILRVDEICRGEPTCPRLPPFLGGSSGTCSPVMMYAPVLQCSAPFICRAAPACPRPSCTTFFGMGKHAPVWALTAS